MKRLCSNIVLQPGKRTKFDQMRTTDGEQLLLWPRKYSNFLHLFRKAQPLAAIPEGTNGNGMEVAIPSIANPMNTSHVVRSREAERFVYEIHDNKEELR